MIFQEGRQLPRRVRKPIILQIFCRRLHENEIIWIQGVPVLGTPLDPLLTLLYPDFSALSMVFSKVY